MPQPLPPADELCFIDANILYYHVVALPGVSDFCDQLVREIMTGRRRAATLSSAVADAVHKVMFSEIVQVHGRPRAGLLAWVKKNPAALAPLKEFASATDEFAKLPMEWLPVDGPLVTQAAALCVRHGLTVNDALIVAAMKRHQIRHLATNDSDFQSVPDITIWKPQ